MAMFHIIFIAFAVVTFLSHSADGSTAKCSFPDPDKAFTNKGYSGIWYEIGKVQTGGGAFFEKDCVCTQLGVSITNTATGDAVAQNDCRSKTVDGPWTNATGTLYNENIAKPGKWLETFGGPPVNYTVIAIGEDFSVEYDCSTSALGITNYCVHIMSRKRTMDPSQFDSLMKFAEDLGLNPDKLPIQMTVQEGC